MKPILNTQISLDLNRPGFDPRSISPLKNEPFENEHISRIRGVIKEFLHKTVTIKKNSLTQAYCLKRNIENYLKESCSHDEIVEAMIAEGFNMEKSEPKGLTCYFNVEPLSIKTLKASIVKKIIPPATR